MGASLAPTRVGTPGHWRHAWRSRPARSVGRSAVIIVLVVGAIGPAASASMAAGPAAGGPSPADRVSTGMGRLAAPVIASSSLVPLPKLSFAIPKATTKYFEVRGSTYTELMDSLQQAAAGPCGSNDSPVATGASFPVGCALSRTRWAQECVKSRCTPTCRVTSVTGSETVYLPRWVAPAMVPGSLLGWWKVVVADIRDHEATHVTIFNGWLATLKKDAVGVSCGAWKSIFARWSARHRAAQDAFDTRAYATQSWPPPPEDAY